MTAYRVSTSTTNSMWVSATAFWAFFGSAFLIFAGHGEYGTMISVVVAVVLVVIWIRLGYKEFVVNEMDSVDGWVDRTKIYWAYARVFLGSLIIMLGTFVLLATAHPVAFIPIALGAALCYWLNVCDLVATLRRMASRR